MCYLLRIMRVFIKMSSALDFIYHAAAAQVCSGVRFPFLGDILWDKSRQGAPKPHTKNEPKAEDL